MSPAAPSAPLGPSFVRRWLPWVGCGCLSAMLAGLVGTRELAAQRPRPVTDAEGLWIADSPLDESRRLLLIVDPASRHAAVYHVDVASGSLVLRSTRDISWDLMIDDFNAQEPRPAALRRMLQAGQPPGSPAAAAPGK